MKLAFKLVGFGVAVAGGVGTIIQYSIKQTRIYSLKTITK